MTALVTILASLAVTGRVRAQTFFGDRPPAKPSSVSIATGWVPPKTADGQPDIQGVYTGESWIATLYALPFGIEFGSANRIPAKSPIVDPSNGELPLQAWVTERRKPLADVNWGRAAASGPASIDPQTRCLPAGVPRANYSTPYNGYHILQRPGSVIIFSEWNHLYRIIPIDGRPHLGASIHLYMGDSRGHWEGNTLVVDVTNFNDKTWLDMSGTVHSDELHVVERFTIVDPNTINYQATIEDPKVFTRPWTLAIVRKRAEQGYELFEYACQEGNHALESMLGGGIVERIFEPILHR
jgi:hypothetical protein